MPEEIERLNYYQLQFLGAEDFQAEQVYHRDMRRRHSIGQHTWGIVTGLELTQTERAGSNPPAFDIFVQPGLAIDGFGREIVVGAPYKLDASDLQFLKPISSSTSPPPLRNVTVHIAYGEEQASPPSFGYGACDDENGQTDRVRELFRIVMNAKPPFHAPVRVDGRDLAESALPSDGSVPYQELPDTATTRWLVPLGTVGWNASDQVFGDSALLLPKDRVYAGVVAEDVIAPAGELHIRRRKAPADVDKDDFAVIEGRLEVQGELHADRKVVVDGDLEERKDIILGGKLSFDTPGAATDPALTMERHSPASGENDLRIRIGEGLKSRLTIGPPPDSTGHNFTVAVRGDDSVQIPFGLLHFGAERRQMLVLREVTGESPYAVGAQDDTLYFRTNRDFCWFQRGAHANGPHDPGGGKLVLWIDNGAIRMFGPLSVTGALTVTGPVTANGPLTANGLLTANGALNVAGPVTASGGLTVAGNTQLQSLIASGSADIGGNLDVAGQANVGSHLSVLGQTSMAGNLAVGGQATVGGPLSANGGIVMPAGTAIELGGARFPLDVMSGVVTKTFSNGTTHEPIKLTPQIQATSAFMHVALASIRNDQGAFNAQWSVKVNGPTHNQALNEFTFDLEVTITDDGFVEAVSYVAFFIP